MNGLDQREDGFSAAVEDPQPIRLAIRIFDERERRNLSQILLLAVQRYEGAILTVGAADAEVVLINPDEPGSAVFIRNARRGKRPVPVVYGGTPETGLPWLAKPARSNDILALFRELPAYLKHTEETVPAVNGTEPASAEAVPPLIPTHDFCQVMQYLHGVRAEQSPSLIETGNGQILIDPRPRAVYVPAQIGGERLASTYAAMSALPAGSIRPLSRQELAERISSLRHDSISLDEFGWSLSFMSRPREPDPAVIGDRRFRLRHWPNFARLEHTQLHLVWAGMMIRQPLSLAMLIARSPQGFAPVARFYNGCALANLLVCSDQQRGAPVQSSAAASRTGIFKRLLEKLAG
jgi:hypothetical protein